MYLTCYAEYGLCLVVCLSISRTDAMPNKVRNEKKKKKKRRRRKEKEVFMLLIL
jgi:hypothetical protein